MAVIGQGSRWSPMAQARYQAYTDSGPAIKQWRQQEHDADRPSGLEDYFRAHSLCFACKSTGTYLSPTGWDGEIALYIECGVCGGMGKTSCEA